MFFFPGTAFFLNQELNDLAESQEAALANVSWARKQTWVNDFPAFPFGRIWTRSLEGSFLDNKDKVVQQNLPKNLGRFAEKNVTNLFYAKMFFQCFWAQWKIKMLNLKIEVSKMMFLFTCVISGSMWIFQCVLVLFILKDTPYLIFDWCVPASIYFFVPSFWPPNRRDPSLCFFWFLYTLRIQTPP